MASSFLSRRDWHLDLLRAKDTMPFKRWLARVGAERLDELENPAIAIDRALAGDARTVGAAASTIPASPLRTPVAD
jgi:hypothetical protein